MSDDDWKGEHHIRNVAPADRGELTRWLQRLNKQRAKARGIRMCGVHWCSARVVKHGVCAEHLHAPLWCRCRGCVLARRKGWRPQD